MTKKKKKKQKEEKARIIGNKSRLMVVGDYRFDFRNLFTYHIPSSLMFLVCSSCLFVFLLFFLSFFFLFYSLFFTFTSVLTRFEARSFGLFLLLLLLSSSWSLCDHLPFSLSIYLDHHLPLPFFPLFSLFLSFSSLILSPSFFPTLG